MRVNKIILIFIIVMTISLTGCNKKEEPTTNIKMVKDDSIKTTLINHISAIESIPKTVELYKKNNVSISDYTIEEYIQIALNQMVNTHQDTYLTAQEKKALQTNNINATSYVNSNDVIASVTDLIGPKTVNKVLTIEGCPSYTYDSSTNRYYVNSECENKERIISYIHEITYDANQYYVEVYAGYVSDNILYNSVNKNNEITKLDNEGSYTIDKNNKDKFTKYIYKFIKNSDGKYIFESIEK